MNEEDTHKYRVSLHTADVKVGPDGKKFIVICPTPGEDIKNGLLMKLSDDVSEAESDKLLADINAGQSIYEYPTQEERGGNDVIGITVQPNAQPER